jgi:TPR repeat protein
MPHAQLELAKCYEHGIGTDADLFEATSWYAYAAKSDLEEASDRFNEIYYSTHFEDENGEQKFILV